MDPTLNRYHASGTHAGTSYEIEVEQWEGGDFFLEGVYVGDFPKASDSDHSFETLEAAFGAGHALARQIIEGGA